MIDLNTQRGIVRSAAMGGDDETLDEANLKLTELEAAHTEALRSEDAQRREAESEADQAKTGDLAELKRSASDEGGWMASAISGLPLTGPAAELAQELGLPETGPTGGVLIPHELMRADTEVSGIGGGAQSYTGPLQRVWRQRTATGILGLSPDPVPVGTDRTSYINAGFTTAAATEGARNTAPAMTLTDKDLNPTEASASADITSLSPLKGQSPKSDHSWRHRHRRT